MQTYRTYRDFDALPASDPSYRQFLYALELSNGVVKVGRTVSPRARMRHHFTAMRARGLRIMRIHVQLGGDESALLRRLRRIATPVGKAREFFTGIPFGAAVNLAKQVSRRGSFSLLGIHGSAICPSKPLNASHQF